LKAIFVPVQFPEWPPIVEKRGVSISGNPEHRAPYCWVAGIGLRRPQRRLGASTKSSSASRLLSHQRSRMRTSHRRNCGKRWTSCKNWQPQNWRLNASPVPIRKLRAVLPSHSVRQPGVSSRRPSCPRPRQCTSPCSVRPTLTLPCRRRTMAAASSPLPRTATSWRRSTRQMQSGGDTDARI